MDVFNYRITTLTFTRDLVLLTYFVVPTQVEEMRAESANLNHCAVPFLSRAAVNLSWYDRTYRYCTFMSHDRSFYELFMNFL